MKFLSYNSPKKGIGIKYPEDWKVLEMNISALVAFLSPLEEEVDLFQENFTISREFSGLIGKLDEFVDQQLVQLKQAFQYFAIIKRKRIRLSGNDAIQVIYSAITKGIEIQILQVYCLIKIDVYMITFTAQASKYPNYKQIVKKMLKSFFVIEKT